MHGREKADAPPRRRKTFEEGCSPPICRPSRCEGRIGGWPRRADAFVTAGLVNSNWDARRQIQGGGVKINDRRYARQSRDLSPRPHSDGVIKLSLGKEARVAEPVLTDRTGQFFFDGSSVSRTSHRRSRASYAPPDSTRGRACSPEYRRTTARAVAPFGIRVVIWNISRKMPGATSDSGLTTTTVAPSRPAPRT